MSDTLADLASWLPSDFLTADDNNHLLFPTDFPYEFASSSSTESESDDDDITALTRRFTRSLSLQERLKIPFPPPPEKKRVFSGSPESTLNWGVSGNTHVRSSPTTPFVQAEEDALDLIYAAAGQVARMKMRMNNFNDDIFANRGLLGAPRPLGPPLSQQQQHQHHLNCAIWRNEKEEFMRQQQFRQRLAASGANYGGGVGDGRPAVGFRQSAWPPLPVENQRRQQPSNGFVMKPRSVGGCGQGTTAVKRECAGTGVFLPRRYNNDPPEPKKKPACSPAQLPARMAQSFNKNMDPIITLPQPNIHPGFAPHYEMLMARRNAAILAHQRRQMGPPETPMEVVLPQEWTY